jgi:hypothetical protein
MDQISIMLAGYRAAGRQPPPREELFDIAANVVLRDEFKKVEEKKITDDLRKRSTQHINRAGGVNVKKNLSPAEEVAALIDAKYYGR